MGIPICINYPPHNDRIFGLTELFQSDKLPRHSKTNHDTMANTYTQIHIQIVFAVRHRRCVISASWRAELYMYVAGVITHHGHKVLCINGVEDHIHIFIGLRPAQSLSALVQEIKKSSTLWIKKNKFINGGFAWQEGFSAFSYAIDSVPRVVRYIQNQEEHHRKRTFREEIVALLRESGVNYDEKYVFKDVVNEREA